MFMKWFRALLPKDESFIDRLCAHAGHLIGGAAAFRDLLAGGDFATDYAAICRYEDQADQVTHQIVTAIHRTFITPFDRSQILALTTALDDTIDLMKETGRRIRLYDIRFTPEMLAMAECALTAVTEISHALPYLNDIGRNVDGLREMQDRVRKAESEADELLDKGLRALFAGDESAWHKLTVERVYDLIELVVDRCEDVADVIESIVVEHV